MLYNFLKERIGLMQMGSTLITKDDLINKINVFFMFNQIDEKQYIELMDLIEPKAPEEPAEG